MQVADQTGTDGRLDGGSEAVQALLFRERRRENHAQPRRPGIEQQPGRDRPAAPDLHGRTEQREVRVGREAHRCPRTPIAEPRGIVEAHAAPWVVDFDDEALQHVVPDEPMLHAAARRAETGERVQGHAVLLELQVPDAE